ncbi:MAG: hypothetical protein H8E66_22960 [Planctomycetes bacterium]|nr:hypothetical protein [Planctomycetota bacterium]
MKKLTVLAFTILLGSLMGCGGEGVDSSAAGPPTSPEQDMSAIEQGVKSGEIDAASYGKE